MRGFVKAIYVSNAFMVMVWRNIVVSIGCIHCTPYFDCICLVCRNLVVYACFGGILLYIPKIVSVLIVCLVLRNVVVICWLYMLSPLIYQML